MSKISTEAQRNTGGRAGITLCSALPVFPLRPLRPPPSAQEAELRLERLLDIATEVFMERGYDGSVDEIAKRARASKQTLYSRYPPKASLFKAVMQRKSQGGVFCHL